MIAQQQGFSLFDKTVGIVGAGQVGSYLAQCLNAIGIKVLLNGPLSKHKAILGTL